MDNLPGNSLNRRSIERIALIGSYPPRQCGIASFTADLASAISVQAPSLVVDSIAMSDRNDYEYSERVCFEIVEGDRGAYHPAADHLNRFGYDILSVQHEYGIFGGKAGSYLLDLVREVKLPVVTTLHTVLREPTTEQRIVMDELLQLSERVVVMSHKAVGFLAEVHRVPPEKIDLIPHGIPAVSPTAGEELRASLKINGPMILTFGLLSPDKGIQYVIEAMPKVLKTHPDAVYVVVGATHPNIKAWAGEQYRESLVKLAKDLGVSESVRFVDRFVEASEVVEYLGAMDIYITPYLNPHQITSGTLAYAVGAGKAVISTPYWYAQELLADGRGVLVPFKDSEAIADSILSIQSEPDLREEMGARAAEYGKNMLWPQVAKRYLSTFQKAKEASDERLRLLVNGSIPLPHANVALPALRLDHLFDLSDDTGILQHATYTVPNRSEGYCVDDNARALLFTAYSEYLGPTCPDLHLFQGRYLSFVLNAFNPNTGRFRNFMSYDRKWLEESGSEDSHGRTLWALGAVVNRCKDAGRRNTANWLFELGLPALKATTSPRTWSYAILGADEYLRAFPCETKAEEVVITMAERLMQGFQTFSHRDWPWFEDSLTYANARLPQALMLAADHLGSDEMLHTGLASLAWLMGLQTGRHGHFSPIGTNGFYVRGERRNFFDEQPVEAASAVSACLTASRISGNPIWRSEAIRAFRWFLGENILGQPVYDATTGGCHDGIHPDRINKNQGAESTLSFLCALAELRNTMPRSAVRIGSYELNQI